MSNQARWDSMCQQIIDHIHRYKRCPSKYNAEERQMVNWMKYNRKQIARGGMDAERVRQFNDLLILCEKYQRINQHAYVNPDAVLGDSQRQFDFTD